MTKGKITAILSNLLQVEVDGPIRQNEICYVLKAGEELMAEVIKINGNIAFAQLFEAGSGLKAGDPVRFSGELLEVSLGPGLLSKNFDGLQNDLEAMPGSFIQAGQRTPALDLDEEYEFTPLVEPGAVLEAGDAFGEVPENALKHAIMLPFKFEGKWEIIEIAPAGTYPLKHIVAKVKNDKGESRELSMVQKWPVKWPIKNYLRKERPAEIFRTGLRVIDSLNPIAEGGTAYIPGAFGTGKTVLQQAIAKNNRAEVVILVACGERANEVVEIFHSFPELEDLATGRKLKDKTTIVCNTSNMPVAAREASVYVGMTMAEYYRSMGHKVLLLADSTSRWAQALREMSNRMEELPGTDAFPVELPAVIANFYGRAGKVEMRNGTKGSVTFLGTVSPAGGNFKEPVTESTSKVARCFYALSQKRADAKRYPAIDPLQSYSRYLDYEEFQAFAAKNIESDWIEKVNRAKNLLSKGIEARDQISILGDDSVPLDYHRDFWKSELIDFAFIQQDSFDDTDMNSSLERQSFMLNRVLDICDKPQEFEDFSAVSAFYKKVINLFKQMNYSDFESDDFQKFNTELEALFNLQSTEA
ncbi:V-type ATP synthase subunit A [Croceimicrobium hydrocarbonivorans]|uniref:V-type ATP synthase alpha chain n=1 Tax=Croceimicrobium hydrocarbonivorans TaxID=2761580 RepID=A0A7H0VEM8_9FLAO|nr:V-type ATP synthase subunit A [Croceimicrobium hydrocarbonivorans]QNR24176.1 V-type ATP synthase subunit A [Croceimicrobium hydrocarbonivorans]